MYLPNELKLWSAGDMSICVPFVVLVPTFVMHPPVYLELYLYNTQQIHFNIILNYKLFHNTQEISKVSWHYTSLHIILCYPPEHQECPWLFRTVSPALQAMEEHQYLQTLDSLLVCSLEPLVLLIHFQIVSAWLYSLAKICSNINVKNKSKTRRKIVKEKYMCFDLLKLRTVLYPLHTFFKFAFITFNLLQNASTLWLCNSVLWNTLSSNGYGTEKYGNG